MKNEFRHGLPSVDAAILAEALDCGDCLLFERFDPLTRKRSRSVVGLRRTLLPGDSFAQTLRSSLTAAAGSTDTMHLVFCAANADGPTQSGEPFPPFWIFRLEEYIELDHALGTIRHVSQGPSTLDTTGLGALLGQAARPASVPAPQPALPGHAGWVSDSPPELHAERVELIKRAIGQGTVHGAVLSIGLQRHTPATPIRIYREMVRMNPSTFGFCLVQGDYRLAGSSPLAFLNYDEGMVSLETDAGTRPVTGNAESDRAAREDLLTNPKDAQEHAVVVEAETEALQPLADGGGVGATVSREVRTFSHVMHLYTVLAARLAREVDLPGAILHLLPPAAVSGRPKQAALSLGIQLEGASRGPYGGVIGLVRGNSHAEFAVVIRSLWGQAPSVQLRVGGKIVRHSDASAEYEEALNKARFLIDSVRRAEQD